MCSKPATTREHAPPKCLFPEGKDFNDGKDYRKNLITVPSCDDHNTVKSMDDQYALLMLVICIENNPTAFKLFSTKLVNTLKRKPGLLKLYNNGGQPPVSVDGQKGYPIQIDVSRIKKSWEQIARALYFHHFNEKWLSKIDIVSPALIFLPENSDDFLKAQEKILANEEIFQVTSEASKALEASDEMKKRYGENKEVFYYQVARQNESVLLKMVFYEGCEVFAVT